MKIWWIAFIWDDFRSSKKYGFNRALVRYLTLISGWATNKAHSVCTHSQQYRIFRDHNKEIVDTRGAYYLDFCKYCYVNTTGGKQPVSDNMPAVRNDD